MNLLYRNKNHCSHTVVALFTHCSSTIHVFKNIKNGSHSTIHTVKNDFTTVFSVSAKISLIKTDPINSILGLKRTTNIQFLHFAIPILSQKSIQKNLLF